MKQLFSNIKQSAFGKKLYSFFSPLAGKITKLFEPEEVEVTMEEDHGKIVHYTYTVVNHKAAA